MSNKSSDINFVDTTVYRLSRPLVQFLETKPSNIDSLSKKCLVDIQTLIDTTLHHHRQLLSRSLSAVPYGNKIAPATSTGDVGKNEASPSQHPSLESNRARRNAIQDETHAKSELAVLQMKRKEKCSKQRAFVAVYPYTELTEEESNTTVLAKLMGLGFSRWWFRWKRVTGVSSILAQFTYLPITYFFFIQHKAWDASGVWLPISSILAAALLVLNYMSTLNIAIVTRCLNTYEGLWMVIEVTMYGLSFWASRCFRLQDGVWPIVYFFFLMPYIFFDGYPASMRLKLRLHLVSGTTWSLTSVLLLYYSRISNAEDVCLYHFDITQGLVRDTESASGGRVTVSRWSFSIFDFCINRGITLLALMMRIVYSAYKHPNDCVVLKSRVRLVETMIKGAPDRGPGATTSSLGYNSEANGSVNQSCDGGVSRVEEALMSSSFSTHSTKPVAK